jgi:hypothetical protein
MSIQNKYSDFPLQSGYYQGSSHLYLRNIWLKIEDEKEGLSLSLTSNEINNQKSEIKILISRQFLKEIQNRFWKGQREFQIHHQESNKHHKIFQLVFSNRAIKRINAREKQPSDQLMDILGLNFKKIAGLHQRKPAFKYETSLRAISAINSLNIDPLFPIIIGLVVVLSTFITALQVGSHALDDLGIDSRLIGLALLGLSIASAAIKRPDLIPAINEGPNTRGVNCSINNQYFSCFHIQDNIITIYWNPLSSKIIGQFNELIYGGLLKEYSEKGINLKLKNIRPNHTEHEYLHNFGDFARLPSRGHTHTQFSGVSVITPAIFHSFIARLMSQEWISNDLGQSSLKKFEQVFLVAPEV